MHESGAQAVKAEIRGPRISHAADLKHPLGALFAPLEFLLAGGGDTRLKLDPADRLNGYGCRPYPRPEAMTFASSTATSISSRAFARADAARRDLIEASLAIGLEAAFDARIDRMRHELKTYLGIAGSPAEIVFSPSGTDSQLHAVFVAQSLIGRRLTNIVAAADETGGGTVLSTMGRHFNSCTAQGVPVEKGALVDGMAGDMTGIEIPLRDDAGRVRDAGEVDRHFIGAVEAAVGEGRNVLLHIMDRSKLGYRSPSQNCVRTIRRRWPNAVQIVVDACQARLGHARIKDYLDRGFMVLMTGSKFFTGAPFSGALLVPERLSRQLAGINAIPPGLCDYTNRSDWPRSWPGIRSRFSSRMNFGQWLRWESALEEMRAYFAVPADFRLAALRKFATATSRLIADSPSLELLPGQMPDESDSIEDGEWAVRTIWPFIIRRYGKPLSPDACTKTYRALNRDVSGLLPALATSRERQLAGELCHIGQPVVLRHLGGEQTAALRISAGARIVSESWSADAGMANENLNGERDQVATILEKIELLVKYYEAIHDRR